MPGYMIEKDGDALRWDWLNFLCVRFPYCAYAGVKPGYRRVLGCRSTLKGARKLIAQDQTGSRIVYFEGAFPVLPDLRAAPEFAPRETVSEAKECLCHDL